MNWIGERVSCQQPFKWPWDNWSNWNFPWNNKAHSVAVQVLVNGKAAPGSEVYLGSRYDVADVDGRTMFVNLATGTYGLTASYKGAILDKSFYVDRDMQITVDLESKTVQVTHTPDYWWLLILLLVVVAIAAYAYYRHRRKRRRRR